MLEQLVERILSKILGDYVEGLQKDKIKVGILKGHVDINSVNIKPDIMKQFNLPLNLKLGKIEHIHLIIPWTNLY